MQLITDVFQETREQLISEISSLSEDQFNQKPDENSWSIAQVCHHVILVEKSTIGAINYGLQKENNEKRDRKNLQGLLDRSVKVKAPKVVDPEERRFSVEEMLAMLQETRNEFIQFVENIENKELLTEKTVKHPAFGYIQLAQWIEIVPLHEKRHLDQIKEIKASIL